MLLMGIAVCNIIKVNTVFDEMFERTESVEGIVAFPADKYRQEYKETENIHLMEQTNCFSPKNIV